MSILAANLKPGDFDSLPTNLKELRGCSKLDTILLCQEKGRSYNERITVSTFIPEGDNEQCTTEAERKASSRQIKTEPFP